MWVLNSGRSVLFLLFLIVYLNWIGKCSQAEEYHNRKLQNQLPATCGWFNPSSTESGLQRELDRFAADCDTTGIKTSTVKTDVHHVSRNPKSVLVASEWSGTEAGTGIKVQASLGCIHKWRKVRQRTRHPNWQDKCNNAKALFGCCETKTVIKSKALNFLYL